MSQLSPSVVGVLAFAVAGVLALRFVFRAFKIGLLLALSALLYFMVQH